MPIAGVITTVRSSCVPWLPGGVMTMDDLAAHSSSFVEPVSSSLLKR